MSAPGRVAAGTRLPRVKLKDRLEQPIPRAIAIGLGAAVLYLVIMSLTDGVDSVAYISAVGVAVGAAVGGEIGRRRADAKRRGGSGRR